MRRDFLSLSKTYSYAEKYFYHSDFDLIYEL